MKDVNKVLLAAAIGLVAGGVIGILLAPDKGSDLRKKIASRAKEISSDVFEEVKEALTCVKEEKINNSAEINSVV